MMKISLLSQGYLFSIRKALKLMCRFDIFKEKTSIKEPKLFLLTCFCYGKKNLLTVKCQIINITQILTFPSQKDLYGWHPTHAQRLIPSFRISLCTLLHLSLHLTSFPLLLVLHNLKRKHKQNKIKINPILFSRIFFIIEMCQQSIFQLWQFIKAILKLWHHARCLKLKRLKVSVLAFFSPAPS